MKIFYIFTARQRSCRKVMFSVMPVPQSGILSTGGSYVTITHDGPASSQWHLVAKTGDMFKVVHLWTPAHQCWDVEAHMVRTWAVCILLDCFLLHNNFTVCNIFICLSYLFILSGMKVRSLADPGDLSSPPPPPPTAVPHSTLLRRIWLVLVRLLKRVEMSQARKLNNWCKVLILILWRQIGLFDTKNSKLSFHEWNAFQLNPSALHLDYLSVVPKDRMEKSEASLVICITIRDTNDAIRNKVIV